MVGPVPLEARAGLPFLTDDRQTGDFQHRELYVASMDFKTAGGWVGDGPRAEINYGACPMQAQPWRQSGNTKSAAFAERFRKGKKAKKVRWQV